MNILVCMKQVPASNQVEIDPINGVLKRNGAESKINPHDLYALETALRLKVQEGGSVSVISMGPLQAEAAIRQAYAMGVDEGVLISDPRFGGADVLATSYTLSQGIRLMGEFDLILCGKQTTDGDTAQVGPETAEWLSIPSVSNVRRILNVDGVGITVEMEMSTDIETTRLCFPCLVAVEKDIYMPRLPSYVKKQAAKDRPVRILTLGDLEDKDERHYGLSGSPTQVQRIFPPKRSITQEFWRGSCEELAERLYEKLRNEKYV